MIPFTHDNVMMIATAVSIIGVIFLLRELNKTREELYELREFSEDVMERLNGIDGDEDETLVADTFNVKPDTWYWMMLEVIGDEMVAQVSGAPVLRAKHPRFNIPKDQINLPTRGGGVVLYDNVKVWNAVQKK